MKLNIVLGVEALARGCHKLRSFNSTGCLHITDKAISCLAQYCHALQVVNLKGCIVSISSYLPPPPIPRQARFPLYPTTVPAQFSAQSPLTPLTHILSLPPLFLIRIYNLHKHLLFHTCFDS